jgi:hypothetical protein
MIGWNHGVTWVLDMLSDDDAAQPAAEGEEV